MKKTITEFRKRQNEYSQITKLLIENGADINIENNNGKKPIDLAQSDDLKMIIQNTKPKTKESEPSFDLSPLFNAIAGRNTDKLIEIVKDAETFKKIMNSYFTKKDVGNNEQFIDFTPLQVVVCKCDQNNNNDLLHKVITDFIKPEFDN